MPISTIVSRGYGSYGGGLNELPTRGYTPGTVVVHVTSTDFYRPADTESASTYRSSVESASSYRGIVERTNTYAGGIDERVQ